MSAHGSTAADPELTRWLGAPGPADDKYTRGVLAVRTGAPQYPGAAVLGVTAAWRTGIGMVRYLQPEEGHAQGLPAPAAAVLAARPETVFGEGRTDAWLIGSGTDPATRSFEERERLTRLLRGETPVVVDAGALELAAELAATGELSAPAILTPHRGEFMRIWRIARLGQLPEGWPDGHEEASPDVLSATADTLARELSVTVLLKGSLTIAATPTGDPVVVGPATPWLATAGTGDVLAGILGSLVARHAAAIREDQSHLRDLGAAAARLHDAAARAAAGSPERPISALDVAEAIPRAVGELR